MIEALAVGKVSTCYACKAVGPGYPTPGLIRLEGTFHSTGVPSTPFSTILILCDSVNDAVMAFLL